MGTSTPSLVKRVETETGPAGGSAAPSREGRPIGGRYEESLEFNVGIEDAGALEPAAPGSAFLRALLFPPR